MSLKEVSEFISSTGFPIAISVYLIVVHSKETRNLTIAINALLEHLKIGGVKSE